jgi:SulP family sulfate permease
MAETVEVDGSGRRDAELDAEDLDQRDDLPPGVEVFRIAGPFFFGVAGELLDTLRRLGQSPRVIILRLRLMPLLDASGAQALEEFVELARHAGAQIILSGVQPQPRLMLDRVGLGETSAKILHAADYARAQSLAVDLIRTNSGPAL